MVGPSIRSFLLCALAAADVLAGIKVLIKVAHEIVGREDGED